jgi:hypothetical protein
VEWAVIDRKKIRLNKSAPPALESCIEELEETLGDYHDRQARKDTEMSATITRVRSEL